MDKPPVSIADLFLREAKKYNVLPLDGSFSTRALQPRPNLTSGRTELVYTQPMIGLPLGDAPSLLNTSYTITADLIVPEGGAERMIVTCGGRFAGYPPVAGIDASGDRRCGRDT
jgi:hypothetical protein